MDSEEVKEMKSVDLKRRSRGILTGIPLGRPNGGCFRVALKAPDGFIVGHVEDLDEKRARANAAAIVIAWACIWEGGGR